ncbi:SAF domain-containing protein [Actinoplanes sp. NEAU-A12]|uniref:SAF domain-containing protein n=1 Tax=Actinoplanes sandaracinus TaxID=3045177 RepID=A0ABT6WXA6_9ACTN|nr:SAF domain-containing protein [Actinoplanes sandaracinus]MDI6104368.1 SAF domain-containing protein [Actinoplanes sandaracinus]
MALGGLLVVLCVLGYAWGAVRLGDRVQVLAVARPVAAGQAITAADLRQVSAAQDPGVQLILAGQADQVVGRTAVVPLVAGTLLTPALVGDAAFPPAGKVAASVALKPGQYPQGLANGARVAVYVSASGMGSEGKPAPAAASPTASGVMPAVVLGVDLAGDGQGATVITLLLNDSDAPKLAAAAGSVVLMQTAPGGN